MPLHDNPFLALSYISGPALLTNASSVLLLGTGNRLGRVVDRARALTAVLREKEPHGRRAHAHAEFAIIERRLRAIGRALTCHYAATALFALTTVISVAGAGSGAYLSVLALDIVLALAVATGLGGFAAFVTGAVWLVIESRLAIRALAHEMAAITASIGGRAIGDRRPD